LPLKIISVCHICPSTGYSSKETKVWSENRRTEDNYLQRQAKMKKIERHSEERKKKLGKKIYLRVTRVNEEL
jgi:hypothetical protein